MQYTEYGRTGLSVSAVGFGGMRFDLSRPRRENADLVRYACERGINYFDTAPGYCNDESEDIFGAAFKKMPRPFISSTKGNPLNFDTAKKAYDAVRKSRDRLGVETIDFYHIWCLREMAHYELAIRPGGQYEGLLRAQEEGLIRHIVCSSHQSGPEIRAVLSDGKVEGCLMGINILNFPYREDGINAARELGLGVVAMNPLSGGAIPMHPDAFKFLAMDGLTPVQTALRFVIAHPGITVALVGFTTREQVDEAITIADNAKPMTARELTAIRKRLGKAMNAICTGCGYCRACPRDIPIPEYMQFYNRKIFFPDTVSEFPAQIKGEKEWGILHTGQPEACECIACGACEKACTQHLPIVERLKEVSAWEKKSAK